MSVDKAWRLDNLYVVLEESLCLYPAGFLLRREVAEDLELEAYPIRKGSIVMVSPMVIHPGKN